MVQKQKVGWRWDERKGELYRERGKSSLHMEDRIYMKPDSSSILEEEERIEGFVSEMKQRETGRKEGSIWNAIPTSRLQF